MRKLIEQKQQNTNSLYLSGRLLIAMPFITDQRFAQTVIYVCGHDMDGAIGIIVNKSLRSLNFQDLMQQLSIDLDYANDYSNIVMHYGGPVEVNKGFILHTKDYFGDSTLAVSNICSLTSTLDILKNIAMEQGPEKFLVALGYTGWRAGQLEQEIQDNNWLVVEATEEILFNTGLELKWRYAMSTIGVDPTVLSLQSGKA